VTLAGTKQSEASSCAQHSNAALEMKLQLARATDLLPVLCELLEKYAATRYSRNHRKKAESALRLVKELYHSRAGFPLGIDMPCKSCGSVNQSKFTAEIGIHFPGLKNIDKPVVWVFPELIVCLDCGAAEFAVPEAELRRLAKRDAAAAS
jgi:hypothetical protein